MCQHCGCATCHETIGQNFNLQNCNLVEIVTGFLVNVMPHQRMKFIHQLRVINNNFRLYGMHFATKMVSSGYCVMILTRD
jgi:hypothetical protein